MVGRLRSFRPGTLNTQLESMTHNERVYEVEVEFINTKNEVSDMYRSHSGLLLMRDMINMCEEIEKDSVLEFPDEE